MGQILSSYDRRFSCGRRPELQGVAGVCTHLEAGIIESNLATKAGDYWLPPFIRPEGGRARRSQIFIAIGGTEYVTTVLNHRQPAAPRDRRNCVEISGHSECMLHN